MNTDDTCQDLYYSFFDRLENDGKRERIIKCQICKLKAPAASTRSPICEMCYEDDFWDQFLGFTDDDV